MASCLKCIKPIPKVDDKNPKIVCHGCERQICVKCSGLLATELRVVVLQSPTLKYLCPDCVLGVRQLPALRKLVTELQSEIEDLKKKQNQCTNLESVINEISERERRSTNVIMYGVAESDSVDSTSRKQHDLDRVEMALASIPGSHQPVAVIRLGKSVPSLGSAPRPLKVVFPRKQSAILVLKTGNELPTGLKVKNDLTPNQQEYLKKLREELALRTDKGELDLTIKYVNNYPKIMKKTPKN